MNAKISVVLVFIMTGCTVLETSVEPLTEQKELESEYQGILCMNGRNLEELVPEWAEEDLSKKDPIKALQPPPIDRVAAVDVRIVNMRRSLACRLLDTEFLGIYAAHVDAAEVDRRLGELEEAEKVFIENEISININNCKGALLSHLGKASYVHRAELVAVKGAMAANPEIEIAQEGVILALRPHIDSKKKSIALDIDLLQARLEDPIPHLSVILPGEGQKMALNVPVTVFQEVRTSPVVLDNGMIMIAGLEGIEKGDVRLAFIRASVVEIEGAAE